MRVRFVWEFASAEGSDQCNIHSFIRLSSSPRIPSRLSSESLHCSTISARAKRRCCFSWCVVCTRRRSAPRSVASTRASERISDECIENSAAPVLANSFCGSFGGRAEDSALRPRTLPLPPSLLAVLFMPRSQVRRQTTHESGRLVAVSSDHCRRPVGEFCREWPGGQVGAASA